MMGAKQLRHEAEKLRRIAGDKRKDSLNATHRAAGLSQHQIYPQAQSEENRALRDDDEAAGLERKAMQYDQQAAELEAQAHDIAKRQEELQKEYKRLHNELEKEKTRLSGESPRGWL